MRDLQDIRQAIDRIDQEMGRLFEERMTLGKEVAEYKIANALPIFDPVREKAILEKRAKAFPEKDEGFIEDLTTFYQTLMDLSKNEQRRVVERPVRIGYYGVPGSFTHQAFLEMYGEDTPSESYQTFADIFAALEGGEIRYGILPIENTSTGIITDVHDLLGKYSFYIVKEYQLSITQNLMGPEGCSLETIREVYSHPQGFAQSGRFLSDYPDWKLIPYYNTSQSAQMVSETKDISKACICGIQNAKRYGLQVIEADIQDNKQNLTRFAVISNRMEVSPGANKISLYFTLDHQPGSLFAALKAFADQGVNLLKIESRPIQGKLWEYGFFVDLEGSVEDPKMKEALREARQHCQFWKVLGNYPSYE